MSLYIYIFRSMPKRTASYYLHVSSKRKVMKKFIHDILAQPLNPCMHDTTIMRMLVPALISPKYITEQGFCRI